MADKASLNDLKLGNDKLEGADFDSIPENLGQSFPDPPQPGKYRFKFPANMAGIWAPLQTEKHGLRISAVFEDESALTIVQSPNGNGQVGEEFRTRISNVPRERTKEKILVSDMALLLRGLGETKTPTTNKAFGETLMKYAGKDFGATVEYSYYCNPAKDAYFDDGQGGQQKAEGRAGCGARYYQRDVPKTAEGAYPLRITCSNPECGASVRAFANLGGFTK